LVQLEQLERQVLRVFKDQLVQSLTLLVHKDKLDQQALKDQQALRVLKDFREYKV
jgi:hypothetical protein